MFDTDMLIGEKFVAGGEAGERVLNPRTEDILVDLPEASLQQVDAAVDCGREGLRELVERRRPRSARRCCSSSPTPSSATRRPSPRSKRSTAASRASGC